MGRAVRGGMSVHAMWKDARLSAAMPEPISVTRLLTFGTLVARSEGSPKAGKCLAGASVIPPAAEAAEAAAQEAGECGGGDATEVAEV